jgi:hypothetical protein
MTTSSVIPEVVDELPHPRDPREFFRVLLSQLENGVAVAVPEKREVQTSMKKITVSDYLIHRLHETGVRHLFSESAPRRLAIVDVRLPEMSYQNAAWKINTPATPALSRSQKGIRNG